MCVMFLFVADNSFIRFFFAYPLRFLKIFPQLDRMNDETQYCYCHRKARSASSQSCTFGQQATIKITRHYHSAFAGSHHLLVSAVLAGSRTTPFVVTCKRGLELVGFRDSRYFISAMT